VNIKKEDSDVSFLSQSLMPLQFNIIQYSKTTQDKLDNDE